MNLAILLFIVSVTSSSIIFSNDIDWILFVSFASQDSGSTFDALQSVVVDMNRVRTPMEGEGAKNAAHGRRHMASTTKIILTNTIILINLLGL